MQFLCRACLLATILTTAPLAVGQPTGPSGRPPSAVRSDEFILGYATRVVAEEMQADPSGLSVRDGVVSYPAAGLGQIERARLVQSLSAVPGVARVDLTEPADAPADAVADPAATPAPVAAYAAGRPPSYVLSRGRLFEPLLADPKWPHFFASYQNYRKGGAGDGGDLENAAAVGFGETISLYRRELNAGGDPQTSGRRLDAGLQAAVFALFDLDADSNDLVNADYFVGPYVGFRDGDFSALARVFHQSSHLGDEFVLRNRVDRVNLSYEGVDALLSYEFFDALRAYGGAGYLFHTDPSDLEEWSVQYGGEYRSTRTYVNGYLRPVAAADFQHREETNWDLDLSLRAGVQLEDPTRFSQTLQLLLEYYNGRSPNGQFYDERIEYYGVGLHLYF